MSEFYLNLDAVNAEVEKAKKGSNGDLYFSRKDIKDNTNVNIRVMPPVKSLNGIPYIKRIRVWINKQPFISKRTFNEPCRILDLFDAIMKGTDENLKALASADSFSVSEDYVLPILLLDPIYDGATLTRIDVVDDKVKIFDCTWTFIQKLNVLLSNRLYQNETPLGLLDRVQGRNIQVTKEVKQRTKYDAVPWPSVTEMPEKYYQEVPDVVAHLRNGCYTDAYVEGVLNNYFLGKPMPDDSIKWPKDTNAPAPAATAQLPNTAAPVAAPPPVQTAPVQASLPQKPVVPAPENQEGGKSLLDMLKK